jgi:hypothetical protein
MSFRRRTHRGTAASACERSAPAGRLTGRHGRLLLVTVEAGKSCASRPTPYDRGWRATFYVAGVEHPLTIDTVSAWEPTMALSGGANDGRC